MLAIVTLVINRWPARGHDHKSVAPKVICSEVNTLTGLSPLEKFEADSVIKLQRKAKRRQEMLS